MFSYHKKLSEQWMLQASDKISQGGEEISVCGYPTVGWYPTRVPSTVLATLVENDVYRDLYVGMNMKQVPKEQFGVPWWYRKIFELTPDEADQTVLISFDGINYKANIWVNGKKVAGEKTVTGAFRRFRFDISGYVMAGENVLALEVIPPRPGDFSIGYVDWNIDPPDHNMGIFREVKLHINKGVSIEIPFVDSQFNTDNPTSASLTINADIVNHTGKRIIGNLKTTIDSLEISKNVTLMPHERKSISFTPHEFLVLNIQNPQLWWPNNLGKPSLYRCEISFDIDGRVSDQEEVVFGIRKVEDFFENGNRGFKINGHRVLIKGAGWTDDLLLQDTYDSLEAQIAYVKHMNLNCIRLEGFWGKDQTLYDLCDQNGILVMAGWSCHWEHEEYLGKPVDPKYGGIIEPEEIHLMARAWEDQVLWLRHHPSIFVWNVGSDKLPHPEAERKYVEVLRKYDPTRPYLNSTGGVGSDQGVITEVELISEISGASGMKMLGPYAYTPPIYWYTDEHFGGAYGYNTETCPGANVPPLESIKKMIPAEHLWPVDEVWEYHCGKNAFRTLDRFIQAIENRYGKPEGVEDFAFKAQVMNYELMRPMFEAFQVNKARATGIVQWMLNSAWPEMYWQLYDSYLMPNGAFYATRKACAPLHLAYHYADHTIHMINDHFDDIQDHQARIRVINIHSQVILDETVKAGCSNEAVSPIYKLPAFKDITETYFLDLRLYNQNDREVDDNFYWLSVKPDVPDYEYEFDDWPFYTPSKEYADLRELHKLTPVVLDVDYHMERGRKELDIEFNIKNPENRLAFFVEMNIIGEKSGQTILPVYWDDNYMSLLPGETRNVKVRVPMKSVEKNRLALKMDGWNMKPFKISLKIN